MRRIITQLMYMDYILCAAIILSQVFGAYSITTLCFYATFFVSFLIWILSMTQSVELTDILVIVIMSLSLLNVAVEGIRAGSSFSFEYMKKLIMFCCTLLFFSAAVKAELKRKDMEALALLLIFITAVFICMFILKRKQMYYMGGRLSAYLTFRFSNPNLTALFLSGMIMFLIITGAESRKPLIAAASIASAGANVFFLVLTKSRNAWIPAALFLALFLPLRMRKRKIALPKWLAVLIAVTPLLVAAVYLLVIDDRFIRSAFEFLSAEGKGLDARKMIWKWAFGRFAQSPVFGAYSETAHGLGMTQMHNSHVEILSSYGIAPLVLTCAFIYMLLIKIQDRAAADPIMTLAFVCMILNGNCEAAVFSGGLAIYLMAGVFLPAWINNETLPEEPPALRRYAPGRRTA